MLAALRQVCSTFTATWSGIPSFATPYGLLIANCLDAIAPAAAQQQGSSKGITLTKAAARAALALHLDTTAKAIRAYALATADSALEADAGIKRRDITLATEDALLGMEGRIHALAAAHIVALAPFGINAATQAQLAADAAAFSGLIGKPRAAREGSKMGTAALKNIVTEAREYLRVMDAQMILFRESAPDFYARYFTARRIGGAGSRQRALLIKAEDAAGAPLAGVSIELPALRLKRKTGGKGMAFIQHAPPGTYEVLARTNNGGEEMQVANINAGETCRLVFVL